MYRFLFSLLLLASCGNPDTPLDADARRVMDSVTSVRMSLVRMEMDSLCQQYRTAELPHLVDSIKKVRLREIQEQLKTVPQ